MSILNPITGKMELDTANAIGVSPSAYTLDLSMWGNVNLPGSGTVAGATVITSAGSGALVVGRQGSTKPVLQVDASTALQVTGIKIKGAGTGAGVAISAIETGGTDNALTIDAMGAGTVTINGTATGAITLARNTSVTGTVTGTSASASALAVGRQGATNPVLQVDASTATVLTGLKLKGAGTGAGFAISVVETGGTNNKLTIDAMGSGQVVIGGTSTGLVSIGRGAASGAIFSSALASFAGTDATMTAARLQGGFIEGSPTGPATYTFDTGANLDTAFPNAVNGDCITCVIAVMTAQTVTWAAGAGNAIRSKAATFVGTTTGACVLASIRKTGGGAWSIYLTAAV